jgi:hypothetical protein
MIIFVAFILTVYSFPITTTRLSWFPVRRKLLCVLDAIEFSQDIPDLLQLDFFERAQIELVITNCEHVNEQGHTVCNVKVRDPLTRW